MNSLLRTIKPTSKHLTASTALTLFILTAIVWLVIAEFSELSASIASIADADPLFLVGSFVCILMTPFVAAASFKALSFVSIPYRLMVLVQLAGLFINRLLPWGAGNISLLVYFLHKHKHTYAQASAVVALNNMAGFVGHMSVLIAIYSLLGLDLPQFAASIPPAAPLILTCMLVVLVFLRIRNSFARKILKFLSGVLRSILKMKDRKSSLVIAVVCNMSNTLLQLGAFYLVLHAFSVDLSFSEASLIFTGGIAALAVTPTPGGIGGVELGIAAGLMAYGIPSAEALMLAFGYRLVSYWLPLGAGIIAAAYARRRAYI